MLERAEQRSKNLGITSAQKLPLTEANNDQPSTSASMKRQNNTQQRKSTSPQKKNTLTMTRNVMPAKRNVSEQDESKENCDVALEINITAGHNVQVSFEYNYSQVVKW